MNSDQALKIQCKACGRENDAEALVCALCGEMIRREVQDDAPPPPSEPVRRAPSPFVEIEAETCTGEKHILGMPRSLFHILLGIPLALLLTWGPILSYAGWFLKSLVHEMGHAAAAWFLGCPSFPAIRLDGHAAAMHGEQQLFLVLIVWAALAYGAYHFRKSRVLLVFFIASAAVYPLCAFTGLKDIIHLAAGHGGELVFATIFFCRALNGGFIHEEGERPIYSTLGWFWMGGNILLFGSLVLSEASRQWYYQNGSFGLRNDFIRLAEDYFHTSLEAACAPMILLSLFPLPVAILIYHLSRGKK